MGYTFEELLAQIQEDRLLFSKQSEAVKEALSVQVANFSSYYDTADNDDMNIEDKSSDDINALNC